MNQPTVLVLLATYNGELYLDAQLRSIAAQTGVAVRVLARDDGSADGTVAVLDRWFDQQPDVLTILPTERSSGSAAMNFFALLQAADLSTCDYIAFADQDDVWFPDKLARAITLLEAAGADGYSSDLLAHDDAGNRGWILEKAGREVVFDYLFQGASAGCTYVLSRTAANLCQGVLGSAAETLGTHLSHDWAIYAICRSHGLRWVRDPHARLVYRQHPENAYGARSGLMGLLKRRRLVKDSWYRAHILWLRHVVVGGTGETKVLDAVACGGLRHRLSLARRAHEFRRTRKGAILLCLAFLTGQI